MLATYAHCVNANHGQPNQVNIWELSSLLGKYFSKSDLKPLSDNGEGAAVG